MIFQGDNPFLTTLWGTQTLQSWVDLILWEQILNEHPRLQCLIEIGTYKGGLAAFMQIQARMRGLDFYTCDIQRHPEVARLELGDHFIECDVLDDGNPLEALLARDDLHPLILFCDGGNKPAEMQKYVPLLRPGDLVGVHDWGTEFKPDDLLPVGTFLIPVAHERHAREGSMTRFWKRTKAGGRQDWGNLAVGVRIAKHPETKFFISWSALLTGGLRPGDTILMPICHQPAHWAANEMARQFLRTNKDTLLMLDDDMFFPADSVEKLRSNPENQGFDVVMGLYTYRVIPPSPLVMHLMTPPPRPASLRGDYFDLELDVPDNQVTPVDAVGLGFTLIRREVLEAMVKPDVGLEYTYWFSYGPGLESDDIPFCRECRKLGFRLAVDSSVHIGHIGEQILGWPQLQAWRKSVRERKEAQAKGGQWQGGGQGGRQEQREGPYLDLQGDALAPILRAAIKSLGEGQSKDTAQQLLAAIESGGSGGGVGEGGGGKEEVGGGNNDSAT